jgi:hypothetical protein
MPIGPHIDATIARSLAIVQSMRFSNWRCSVEQPAKSTDIAITTIVLILGPIMYTRAKTYEHKSKAKRITYRPLRTFKEMAEEFGVTTNALRTAMINSRHEPPKKLLHTSSLTCANSYYDPAEMRAWWKLHTSSVEPR